MAGLQVSLPSFFFLTLGFLSHSCLSQETMCSTINVSLLVNKQIVQFALYNHWQQSISSFGVILEFKIFYLLFAYLESAYDMDIHHHEHYSFFSFCSFCTFQPRRRLQWKLPISLSNKWIRICPLLIFLCWLPFASGVVATSQVHHIYTSIYLISFSTSLSSPCLVLSSHFFGIFPFSFLHCFNAALQLESELLADSNIQCHFLNFYVFCRVH